MTLSDEILEALKGPGRPRDAYYQAALLGARIALNRLKQETEERAAALAEMGARDPQPLDIQDVDKLLAEVTE